MSPSPVVWVTVYFFGSVSLDYKARTNPSGVSRSNIESVGIIGPGLHSGDLGLYGSHSRVLSYWVPTSGRRGSGLSFPLTRHRAHGGSGGVVEKAEEQPFLDTHHCQVDLLLGQVDDE